MTLSLLRMVMQKRKHLVSDRVCLRHKFFLGRPTRIPVSLSLGDLVQEVCCRIDYVDTHPVSGLAGIHDHNHLDSTLYFSCFALLNDTRMVRHHIGDEYAFRYIAHSVRIFCHVGDEIYERFSFLLISILILTGGLPTLE